MTTKTVVIRLMQSDIGYFVAAQTIGNRGRLQVSLGFFPARGIDGDPRMAGGKKDENQRSGRKLHGSPNSLVIN